MSITTNVSIDRIDVIFTENGPAVQVREATSYYDGDELITKKYHRVSFIHGDDWSSQPQNVRDVCDMFLNT